jgi:hypothetical protein
MRFTPTDKTCQQCGKVFHITRKVDAVRKFCGSACYHAYEKEHGKPEMKAKITVFACQQCGKPFQRTDGELRSYRKIYGKDPLYCSRLCSGIGRRRLQGPPCVVCGKEVPVEWKASKDGRRTPRVVGRKNKICSPECRSKFKLAEHDRLRPTEERGIQRNITSQGYVRLRFPNKYGAKGREVLEHRYVMEQALGRELRPEETVHHKNGQRQHNTLDNLELRSGNHGPGGDVPAMIRWAHEFIALYPQFDREGNFIPAVQGDLFHQ